MSSISSLSRKHILVTGGGGFLGSWVVKRLRQEGAQQITIARSSTSDLRDPAVCKRLVQDHEIIVHLAARVGGIGLNDRHPGELFYDNALMGIHLLEAARRQQVEKLLIVGTACSYPKYCPVPFREDDLWSGYPEEVTGVYGMVKKMLLVQAHAYRKEYGLNAIYLIPVNLYGPNDHIHAQDGHVIPSLIHRMMEAKKKRAKELVIWGSGAATREFLYVEDAAEGIVLALKKYNDPHPMNLGTGQEISIRDLVTLLQKVIGYRGSIGWDPSKPDGQPRRCLDTSRCRSTLGFSPMISLEEGLRRTVTWYTQAKRSND